MLVTHNDFETVVSQFAGERYLSLDCEATGLSPWLDDRLFSIIIGTEHDAFYFNYYSGADHLGNRFPDDTILPTDNIPGILGGFKGVCFLHNAKYDMALLSQEGLELDCTIHCTMAQGRVEFNDHRSYALAALGEKIGHKKDDTVKKYLDEHKLYDVKEITGKKAKEKDYHYELVPREIMVRYGLQDARVTYELGKRQMASILKKSSKQPEDKQLVDISKQERALTPILYRMEKRGILLDREYVSSYIEHSIEGMEQCVNEFENTVEIPFKDSAKVFVEAFDKLGEPYPLTEKGNPSFKKDTLDQMTTPVAQLIKKYRKHKSHFSYLHSFLRNADRNGYIHANFFQSGTKSGRISVTNPAMQCVEKFKGDADKEPFLMRRCFRPPPGYAFCMQDYDQMEYRLMLEYAKEMGIIENVLRGTDVHQATADMVGRTRDEAKTLNFKILYGAGCASLTADLHNPILPVFILKEVWHKHRYKDYTPFAIATACNLNMSDVEHDIEEMEKGQDDLDNYFKNMPNVKKLIDNIKRTAKERKYVINWAGRRLSYNHRTYYSAPNGLIQGGCADIVKQGMVMVDYLLESTKSFMTLSVHDEILTSVHLDELDTIPLQIKAIMEGVYPHKFLPLTVGTDIGYDNWQDKA